MHRCFYEFYEETVSDPQNGTASIIMCDIDFFKKVNDTYGHNAGDAVLQRIAAVLQEHVHLKMRRCDGVAKNLS